MQRDSIINAYYISVSAFPGKENFIKSHNFCHPIVKKNLTSLASVTTVNINIHSGSNILVECRGSCSYFPRLWQKYGGGKSSFALESFHFYFTGNSFNVLFSVGFTSSFASTSFSSQE